VLLPSGCHTPALHCLCLWQWTRQGAAGRMGQPAQLRSRFLKAGCCCCCRRVMPTLLPGWSWSLTQRPLGQWCR
jgi:hypothetical protein